MAGSEKEKISAGFTIAELLIAFGIFALVMAIGLPFGLDSYRNYILTSEERNLVSLLRRAENMSLSNNAAAAHGLAIQSNGYVLYQGNSYSGRNQSFDEVYPRASLVSVSSTDINFQNLSGLPSTTGTLTLSNGVRSLSITVNAQGTLLW